MSDDLAPNGLPWLDPAKEVAAACAAVEATKFDPRRCGLDWEEMLARRELERRWAAELGIDPHLVSDGPVIR